VTSSFHHNYEQLTGNPRVTMMHDDHANGRMKARALHLPAEVALDASVRSQALIDTAIRACHMNMPRARGGGRASVPDDCCPRRRPPPRRGAPYPERKPPEEETSPFEKVDAGRPGSEASVEGRPRRVLHHATVPER
jgi:hypothetical protein